MPVAGTCPSASARPRGTARRCRGAAAGCAGAVRCARAARTSTAMPSSAQCGSGRPNRPANTTCVVSCGRTPMNMLGSSQWRSMRRETTRPPHCRRTNGRPVGAAASWPGCNPGGGVQVNVAARLPRRGRSRRTTSCRRRPRRLGDAGRLFGDFPALVMEDAEVGRLATAHFGPAGAACGGPRRRPALHRARRGGRAAPVLDLI